MACLANNTTTHGPHGHNEITIETFFLWQILQLMLISYSFIKSSTQTKIPKTPLRLETVHNCRQSFGFTVDQNQFEAGDAADKTHSSSAHNAAPPPPWLWASAGPPGGQLFGAASRLRSSSASGGDAHSMAPSRRHLVRQPRRRRQQR